MSQKFLEHLPPRINRGKFDVYTVCETAPDGGIEKMLMIRGGQNNRLSLYRIDILQKADHDSLQFAEFLLVVPQFRERIEFIEEEDAGASCDMVKEKPQVFRCAAKERRDQRINAGGNKGERKFCSDVSCEFGFSASGRTVHQKRRRYSDSFFDQPVRRGNVTDKLVHRRLDMRLKKNLRIVRRNESFVRKGQTGFGIDG